MANKGKILWQHRDIAKSSDGSPNYSIDDVIYSTNPEAHRFKPDLNQLIDNICKTHVVAYMPEGEDITFNNTVDSAAPGDFRHKIAPWLGKHLVVMAGLERTAGAGTVTLGWKVEYGGSRATGTALTVNTAGLQYPTKQTMDLSTFPGSDVRGVDGSFEVYLKVSDGTTTGVLRSLVVLQVEDVSTDALILW